jgi:hypothetical protein
MELAVGDLREERTAPDHPLRAVSDYLHQPSSTLDQRATAVSTATSWLREGQDLLVGLRVLMHAVHPGTRHVSSDPGLGNTVNIAEGTLSLQMIRGLGELWDLILDTVERHGSDNLAPVIRGLHPWVYPGSLAMGRGADQLTSEAMREIATRVVSRLAAICHDRPGTLRLLSDYAVNAGLAVTLEIPEEFQVLFPHGWDGSEQSGGYEDWAQRVEAGVRRLADELQKLPAAEIAARIAAADTEASNAGITSPRLTPNLAQVLASDGSPDDLLEALEQQRVAADVLLPVLSRLVELRADRGQAVLERLLGDQTYSQVAMYVALTRDHAIRHMTARQSNLVESVVIRGEADTHTLVRLLNAPDPAIARSAAVALAMPSGAVPPDRLPTAAHQRWREIIVQSPAEEHWYSAILGRDPALFGDWLKAWFDRVGQGRPDLDFLPNDLTKSISTLPQETRLDLIRAIPSDAPSIFIQDVVTELVSDDVEAAEALLERHDLSELHSNAFRNGPNEAWMKRAMMALRRGWEPRRIVASTMFAGTGWSGEESTYWQAKIDAFEALREVDDPERNSIVQAGVELFERLRAEAAAAERRERVFG